MPETRRDLFQTRSKSRYRRRHSAVKSDQQQASLPAGDTNTVAVVAATAGPDASGHAASAATAAAVAIAPPFLDRLTSSTFHEGASCVKERSDVCVGAEISLRPVGEVLYGLVRATILYFAVAAFLGLHAPNANYGAALALLALASISFIGVGIMTSVLPLISPEKGAQLGFVCQGVMLVVSGVYYPVSVMPEWMQWIAKFSPATYALRGCRNSIVYGTGLVWADVWPLLIIAVLATPIGLRVFRVGERHAKKHGKLKRSG